MTDFKVIKPVASSLTGTSSTPGAFPPPVAAGNPVGAAISPSGVLYVAIINDTGTFEVTVGQDQTAAPVALPVGAYVNAIFRSTLPTYANGQSSILHTDNRGRLFTATIDINTGNVASVDEDAQPATVNPVGTYVLWKFQSPLPTYANGDAIAPHADSRGRLLITQTDPTTNVVTDVTQDATVAPANPVGTWPLAIYNTVLPTYLNGQATVLHTSVNGELLVNQAAPTTTNVTSVAASVASVTLLALNATRKGASIFNDSVASNLYLKLGAVASLVSFTVKIGPGGFYEVPSPVYTGVIDGIWDVAAGNARVTEITP